jgi:hypothetical protein
LWTYSREPAQQHWPWLKKIALAAPGDGGVEIGVRQDDRRRLAAEFERHLLQVAGRGLDDQLADLGRAGEGDLVDVGMCRQRRAGVSPKPVRMLTTPGGKPASRSSSARRSAGQRRLLGRLQHHRAAGGQRRPSFHAAISSGKFHGMIWPTTPTGSRTV